MGVIIHNVVKAREIGEVVDQNKAKVSCIELSEKHLYPIYPDPTTFAKSAIISNFELFEDPKSGPRKLIWTWDRTNPSSSPGHYLTVVEYLHGGIILINTNSTVEFTIPLYFKVTVSEGQNPYPTDPELVIPKRGWPLHPYDYDCPGRSPE